MATVAISASLQRACSSNHVTKKQQPQIRPVRSVGTKQVSNVVTLNVEGQKRLDIVEQQEKSSLQTGKSKNVEDELKHGSETESSVPKFMDERWKNGTWDLNMFVKDGKMDWDGLIVAGRAAMVGFFMAYIVDALTGLDVVGQTGNLVCKAGVFLTVVGVILFRQTDDFKNLKNLADEATLYDKQWQATLYDKQWQASWEDQNSERGKKI